ncbi:MAG: hydrogenase expression/formation protein [Gammaproteobacteria bacterium]
MPKGMATHQPIVLPELEDSQRFKPALALLRELSTRLDGYRVGTAPVSLDLSLLDEPNRSFVNQMLGEGEVSIRVEGVRRAVIQESVLAGVWLVRETDAAGRVVRDTVEAGEIPALVQEAVRAGPVDCPLIGDIPQGVSAGLVSAMPLLTEIQERVRAHRPGQAAHVINLSLLPVSAEDLQFLSAVLGTGTVYILSRGYGNCRITNAGIAKVWWVQYYNSTDALILNTLEIGDVPAAACAAPEDIEDSAQRLRETLETL